MWRHMTVQSSVVGVSVRGIEGWLEPGVYPIHTDQGVVLVSRIQLVQNLGEGIR